MTIDSNNRNKLKQGGKRSIIIKLNYPKHVKSKINLSFLFERTVASNTLYAFITMVTKITMVCILLFDMIQCISRYYPLTCQEKILSNLICVLLTDEHFKILVVVCLGKENLRKYTSKSNEIKS